MSVLSRPELSEQKFNEAVAEELRDRNADPVADMSRRFDRRATALSAAQVAENEGLSRTGESVGQVADLREDWFCVYQDRAEWEAAQL